MTELNMLITASAKVCWRQKFVSPLLWLLWSLSMNSLFTTDEDRETSIDQTVDPTDDQIAYKLLAVLVQQY